MSANPFERDPPDYSQLRVPPQAVEAEQHVLGCLLFDNRCWDRIGDVLAERDFYRHEHRILFGVIAALITAFKPADLITVVERVEATGELGAVGGMVYVNQIAQCVSTTANARRYAEIVREKALRRAVIAAADEICTSAFGGTEDFSALADKASTAFADLQARGIRKMPRAAGDLIAARLDHYNAMHQGEHPVAWSTGLAHLDRALNGGLRPGKVYVIAARPSVGKSSLAQAIALTCARAGVATLMLSQEMEDSECMDRAISNVGGIDYEHLQTGALDDMDWGQLSDAAQTVANLPFFIDDEGGLTLASIRAKAMSLRREGLKVLVLDYLQLSDYQASKGQSTNDAVGTLSKGLKKLAKDLGVALILLSQLNRDVEKRGSPKPMLSDLRDSGAVEQDADVVMMLWRARTWKDRQVMGLALAKNRQGRFKGDLALEFFGDYQRWVESEADISPDKQPPGGKDFE